MGPNLISPPVRNSHRNEDKLKVLAFEDEKCHVSAAWIAPGFPGKRRKQQESCILLNIKRAKEGGKIHFFPLLGIGPS